MKTLTIIIPFRNEGSQVLKTCESFNRHCDAALFDILCINDSSDDGYDYSELTRLENVRLIDNAERLGVAGSRDKGTKISETRYVLFVDGHMRVFEDVITPLLQKLHAYPNVLFCCQSRVIRFNEKKYVYEIEKKPKTKGVFLHVDNLDGAFLDYEWDLLSETDLFRDVIPIQCCMGACYAIDREYYILLHGLNGLQQWGMDEQFLSAKVWMSGGQVLLLKNVEIAHVYRAGTPIPYESMKGVKILNQLIVTYLLAEREMFDRFRKNLAASVWSVDTQLIVDIFDDLKPFLDKERIYLNLVMKYPFVKFLNLKKDGRF